MIICAVFLAAVGVFLAGFIFDGFSEEVPKDKDNTQMQITDTPTKNESDSIENKEDALTPKQIYNKVYESSVGVLVYTSNQQTVYSEGTGIVMGENADGNATYIITCAHVIDVANPKILVQTEDGTQYDAIVVGLDVKTDIGLIRVSATGLKAAEFADSDTLGVGDYVYAIGNPGGTQFFGSFTNGMVSAIGRPVDSPVGYEVSCIQHTAPINPGNSGGALVNEYGQVVGINSSKIAAEDYEGMGFAVPSATVKEIVDELIAHGKVTNRPVLGITYYAATYSQTHSIIVKTHNLPSNSIIIEEIMIGSDLANKSVKSGDMIIAVNGKDMDNDDVLLDIIENGKVNGVSASDVQKILNLKHAWEFILDRDVIQCESSYYILCHIAKLVNEGFYSYGGRIRGVPVTIGGTSYVPPLPIETVVMERIDEIVHSESSHIENAINLCLYCMKTQIFNDGNKRASVIFANHYLISKGEGFIAIPEDDVPEFKRLLISYYEDKDNGEMMAFMKAKCWKTF